MQGNEPFHPMDLCYYDLVFPAFSVQSYWLPYVLFTVLALLEQSAMLTFWVLVKRDIIPYYPMIPASVFSTYTNATMAPLSDTHLASYDYDLATLTTPDPAPYFGVLDHDLFLVSVHFGLFLIAVLFMTTTLCCVRKDDDDDWDDSYSSY